MGALAGFALACAGELDDNPEDYERAYVQGATGGRPPVGGFGGGGGTAGGQNPVPADPACLKTVLEAQCLSCHTPPAIAGGGFDLTGTQLGERLSKTLATYQGVSNRSSCKTGALIIDPANPPESILLRKVSSTQACGEAMPFGFGLLGTELECIQNWVKAFGGQSP